MKILVLGSGGREHALVWRLSQEAEGHDIYVLPGNAGMAEIATCLTSPALGDVDAIAGYAQANSFDLVVVGPEQPLVDGVVDALAAKGIKAFGPSASAARLEGSKIFSKELMAKYSIPTAAFDVFDDEDSALWHLKYAAYPLVVKADGLAAGKGVTVAASRDEAEKAVRDCFTGRLFGSAGDRVLIEECLTGYEVSILAFVDGEHIVPLAPAQDYKRAYDGGLGPNTGGMGCYSPVLHFDESLGKAAWNTILRPSVDALISEGIDYRGILYAGVMVTASGPIVLEYNCRFGDPETQAIMPRLSSSLSEAMLACIEGRLSEVAVTWAPQRCVSVVMASGGYPGTYENGMVIEGLKEAGESPGAVVFHAGTAMRQGSVVTNGGRVLNVTALGDTYTEARTRAYDAVGKIHFQDMQFRNDIAAEPSAGGN